MMGMRALMKKLSVKAFAVVMTAILGISVFSAPVSAAEFAGTVYYTDVVTYINHNPIPSWILNGYPLIAVEDLNNYGFDVLWNPDNKTLRIFRNTAKTTATPVPVYLPRQTKLGTKEVDLYRSDVKVYANEYEYEMVGYSGIDGYTLIYVGDLVSLGGVSMYYVPENKAVNVWVDGMEIAEYRRPPYEGTTTTAATTTATTTQSQSSDVVYYDYIDENMPEWARDTISKLVNLGYIQGDAYGRLRLTMEDLRYFVVNDRAGVYN